MMCRLLLALLVLLLVGCGPELEPPSQLRGLRVLAVQKDPPYARPGEEVTLRMLYHDAAEEPRDVEIGWLAACFNPPGDSFLGCAERFAELLEGAASGEALPEGIFDGAAAGPTFSFRMPEDIISARPRARNAPQPPRGLAVVFFAACAGKIDLAPVGEEGGFPLACYEPGGERLGPDDFVAGFSLVSAYEEPHRNENPIVDGFELGEVELPEERICIGAECIDEAAGSASEVITACDFEKPWCVPVCHAEEDEDCPPHRIRPIVDPRSAELDTRAAEGGEPSREQLWINYYVDQGSVDSVGRLLNDIGTGWNEEHWTALRAPREPGPFHVWAVVHDSRGGVSWVRADLVAWEP